MTGDPAEELLRRLNDDAVLASQVPRPQYLERILGERRRRHVRTVRSVARSRNQPKSLAAAIAIAVLALLLALAVRANAAPRTSGSALPSSLNATETENETDTENVLTPDGATPEDAMLDARIATGAPGDLLAIVSADDLPLGPLATVVLRTAPPLAAVIAAAQRAAGLDRVSDQVASWRARSRWSALIPTVSVRAGNTASWREVDDPTLLAVSHGAAFDIRASWRLDELLYDPNELRFTGFDLTTRRERRKVATITAHVYFAWIRAASRAADAAADPRIVLRAAELAAQLDALTDGWFSEKRTTRNR